MGSTEREASRPRGLPFEVHRVLEYLLGLALAGFGISVLQVAIVGAGLGVLALAATTRGRLGIRRWLPTGVHRILDAIVIAAIALAPFAAGAHAGLTAVVLEPSGAVLLLLMLRTDYRPRPRAAAGPPPSDTLGAAARQAGRLAGLATRAGRGAVRGGEGPHGPDLAGAAGRRLGRVAGRMRAAAGRARPPEETAEGP